MRLHYFDRPAPDEDDLLLGDARAIDAVPATCLLGGDLIWRWIKLDVDPCSKCYGPRKRCGGRPNEDDRSEEEMDPERARIARLFLPEEP